MSELIKDIQQYLIAGGLAVADGVDLFRDKVPDSPDAVIVISEYSGSPMTPGVGAMDRSIQVIVRQPTYALAKSISWALFRALTDAIEPIKNITATRWGIMHARMAPIKLSEDAHTRIQFVFNIGITTLGD